MESSIYYLYLLPAMRCIGIRQVVDTADEIIAILRGRKSVRDEFLSIIFFFFRNRERILYF